MASVFKRTDRITNPDGTVTLQKRKTWTVKYRAGEGIHRTKGRFKSKEAALSWGMAQERKTERRSAGIHDPFEEHLATPLDDHVAEYKKFLFAKGDKDTHVDPEVSRVEKIVAWCGFKVIGDISTSKVLDYLAFRKETPPFCNTTWNAYLGAFRGFCRWLANDRRAPHCPLSRVEKLSTEGENSRPRRAMTDKEFTAVINAARSAVDRRKVPGKDRAILYMVASYTGFRAGELASLEPASFDISASSVTVGAGYSKRGRDDTAELRSDLCAVVAEWLKDKPAGERLWPGLWYRKAADLLRVDLDRAEVPYVVDGKVLDFHALRHTFITNLHRSGTYGRLLQKMARHSTAALTARYTHVDLSDVQQALSQLPPIPQAQKPAKKRKRA